MSYKDISKVISTVKLLLSLKGRLCSLNFKTSLASVFPPAVIC